MDIEELPLNRIMYHRLIDQGISDTSQIYKLRDWKGIGHRRYRMMIVILCEVISELELKLKLPNKSIQATGDKAAVA